MDGWVGGSARKYSHFVAPSCKLRLARFSAELEIFQMGPSMAIYGDQESRVGKDSILSSWLRLKRDLTGIENRGEVAMIIGDI